LAPTVDRLRQRLTKAGLRVYSVYLVWTIWDGAERGDGNETLLRRVPILPNPLVEDLNSVAFSPFSGGILPVGSVRVSQITTRLTADALNGKSVPPEPYYAACGIQWPGAFPTPPEALALTPAERIGGAPLRVDDLNGAANISFFYEVVENDVTSAQRKKFRPAAAAFKRPGKFDWSIVLERISEDMDRQGHPRHAEEVP
jgi:hypothetical protein